MNYTLTFTQQEMLYVLNVLAQQPYHQVAALIGKLQQQVQQQDTASAIPVSELGRA